MIKQLTLRSGNNATYGTLLQTEYSLSSLIPMHAQLSVTYHSASNRKRGGSLRKSPHSLLSGYSIQEKLHTHMKYKSIPAAATYWGYKFSCKYGLFMPSHLPHYAKHKYYTQYRQRGCLQRVSRQKS